MFVTRFMGDYTETVAPDEFAALPVGCNSASRRVAVPRAAGWARRPVDCGNLGRGQAAALPGRPALAVLGLYIVCQHRRWGERQAAHAPPALLGAAGRVARGRPARTAGAPFAAPPQGRAKRGELHYLDSAQAYFDDAVHFRELASLCSYTHPRVWQDSAGEVGRSWRATGDGQPPPRSLVFRAAGAGTGGTGACGCTAAAAPHACAESGPAAVGYRPAGKPVGAPQPRVRPPPLS